MSERVALVRSRWCGLLGAKPGQSDGDETMNGRLGAAGRLLVGRPHQDLRSVNCERVGHQPRVARSGLSWWRV